MCYAQVAADNINAFCRLQWPEKDFANMASTWANGSVIDAYDHSGGGSFFHQKRHNCGPALGGASWRALPRL